MKISLREHRNSKNLTVRHLSDISGVSKSHISAIENGEKDPTLTVMCKLAAALHEDVWTIFSCEDINK